MKKRKTAVALRYNPLKDGAPKISAKGIGSVAENIIDLAKKHGIPIKDDPDLVEILAKLDIEKEIPPDVYLVVAELLAFVYSANNKKNYKE